MANAGISYETGHTPSESYMDRNGNFHLNGSALAVDETSAQISASETLLPGATLIFSSLSTVTATGSGQSTAVTVSALTSVVVSADGTKGILLPPALSVGQELTILNTNGTHTLNVYPDAGNSGGSINGGSANAAALLPPAKGATYICTAVSPTAWWSASN